MSGFEKFVYDVASTCKSTVPTITGNKTTGRFFFNAAAIKKFELAGKYCELYFDKDARKIGIKLLSAQTYGSVPMRVNKGLASMAATKFCKFYGIDLSNIKHREVEQLEDCMLVIQA